MKELIEQLAQDGWRSFRSQLRSECLAFYKPFEGHPECVCNDGKRKQVEVYLYQSRNDGRLTAEIECNGEVTSGHWIKIQLYAFNDCTFETITGKVQEALRVWDHAAKP